MQILDTLIFFIKALPAWLGAVVEVMIVAVLFMTAMTFLAGIWCGLKVVGKRASSIKEITFFPPRIIFHDKED